MDQITTDKEEPPMDHSQNGKTLLMALAAVPVSHVINDTDKGIYTYLQMTKVARRNPKRSRKLINCQKRNLWNAVRDKPRLYGYQNQLCCYGWRSSGAAAEQGCILPGKDHKQSTKQLRAQDSGKESRQQNKLKNQVKSPLQPVS